MNNKYEWTTMVTMTDTLARIPYLVKGKSNESEKVFTVLRGGLYDGGMLYIITDKIGMALNPNEYKLLLQPMSSMTEEEQKEFDEFCVIDYDAWMENGIVGYKNQAEIMTKGVDWLNAHHFDYRGLIEMGLALEAPEGLYTKNEMI